MRGVAWLGSSLSGPRAAESSSSWEPAPPSYLDHCRCVAIPRRRGLHRRLIVVVAALSWWWSSSSLVACGCYGHTGLALAPAAATVAEVSMWGGGLGCGKAMVGVGARAVVRTCN